MEVKHLNLICPAYLNFLKFVHHYMKTFIFFQHIYSAELSHVFVYYAKVSLQNILKYQGRVFISCFASLLLPLWFLRSKEYSRQRHCLQRMRQSQRANPTELAREQLFFQGGHAPVPLEVNENYTIDLEDGKIYFN